MESYGVRQAKVNVNGTHHVEHVTRHITQASTTRTLQLMDTMGNITITRRVTRSRQHHRPQAIRPRNFRGHNIRNGNITRPLLTNRNIRRLPHHTTLANSPLNTPGRQQFSMAHTNMPHQDFRSPSFQTRMARFNTNHRLQHTTKHTAIRITRDANIRSQVISIKSRNCPQITSRFMAPHEYNR